MALLCSIRNTAACPCLFRQRTIDTLFGLLIASERKAQHPPTPSRPVRQRNPLNRDD